jgi:hypothetical protein
MGHAGLNKESILLLKEHQGWKDTLSCPYFVIVNRIVGGHHAKRALALFKTSNRNLLFNHFIAESTGIFMRPWLWPHHSIPRHGCKARGGRLRSACSRLPCATDKAAHAQARSQSLNTIGA